MEQKQIGIIILIIGLILGTSVTLMKINEDKYINSYISDKGSCFLDDGTCLHEDRDYTLFIVGWIIVGILILISGYMILVKSPYDKILKENQELIKKIEKSNKKNEFEIFLSSFDEDYKTILKIIKDNEGITQATLRFKTGFSKAHVSNLVNTLEKKNFISRKRKRKTYQIYLKSKY